uniref:Uncharacterized protein n=1 Tax=Romanomermis culicivorax TaxID=13658 RepID=A0A915IGI4_ROMCU
MEPPSPMKVDDNITTDKLVIDETVVVTPDSEMADIGQFRGSRNVEDGHSLSPGCQEIAKVDAICVDADLHRHCA